MSSRVRNRKTILFVDDEPQFLELLQTYMEMLGRGEWEVVVAGDSGAALAALDSRQVDLAVLDVRMPVVDGVQLLQLINRKHPQLKKAVLSGYINETIRATASNGGAELVLEKPSDPAGYEALFTALNELVRLPVEQGFRGMLRRVGLEDIIQMECLSRHSLILEVAGRGLRGRIYIQQGALVHAEFGELTGEPALHELFTLSGGEFNHRPFTNPPRVSLEGSWEFLVMEAVRKRDEAAGASAEAATAALESDSISDAAPPADHIAVAPLINELVVCSDKGEPLYALQSANAPQRCAWCIAVLEGSGRLQEMLPLGDLERIEFISASGRMIARFHEGHSIFLRANDE